MRKQRNTITDSKEMVLCGATIERRKEKINKSKEYKVRLALKKETVIKYILLQFHFGKKRLINEGGAKENE